MSATNEPGGAGSHPEAGVHILDTRTIYGGMALLFLALLLAGGSVFHPVEYDNTASRYYLVSALVDHGTWNIDPYHAKTIDKSFYDGHFYSNKGVGAALLGVPVYWLMRCGPGQAGTPPLSAAARYWIRVVTTTVPFALTGAVMFMLACRLGAQPRKALLMVLAYGIGTPALIHATLYSGHGITAACLFGAFALIRSARLRPGTWSECAGFLGAGLLAGWAVLTDYPALLLVGVLALYAFSWGWRKAPPWWFVAGGLPAVLIFMGCNQLCFGSPFSLSYAYLSHEKFSADASLGLFGVRWPNPLTLWRLLMSPSRGLVLISPVLLLVGSGLRGMWTKGLRREAVAIAGAMVIYLLFNASYIQWHGGWMLGPRYLTPMLALAAFPLAFARFRPFTWLCLMLPSVGQIGAAVFGMPHAPEVIVNPVPELIIPLMASGYMAANAGMLAGLTGAASVAVTVLLVGMPMAGAWTCVAGAGGAPEEDPPRRREQVMLTVALLAVMGTLVMARTPSRGLLYRMRSRLLRDASLILRSEPLRQESIANWNAAVRAAEEERRATE